MTHNIDEYVAPTTVTVRCSCGWTRQFVRRNALARKAKMRAAIAEHVRNAVVRTED